MATKQQINETLAELRQIIDTVDDPVAARVAYLMEHAIRWATMDTDWPPLSEWPADEAHLIRLAIRRAQAF